MLKKWDGVNVAIDLDSCSYSLELDGVLLENCAPRIENRRGELFEPSSWRVSRDSSEALLVDMTSALGEASLRFSSITNSDGVPGVKVEFKFDGEPDERPAALVPLHISSLPTDHVLVHGRKMGGCLMIDTANSTDEFSSVFQCVFTSNGKSLQLTHPLRQKNQSEFSGIVSDGSVLDFKAATTFGYDDLPLVGEPISIFASSDGHALMRSYGSSQATSGKSKLTLPPGWNSWDYYRWTITEEEALSNAEFIKNDPVLSKHVKRITVDDGWQYCYGEWDANPFFPSGMAKFAEKLINMGFEPGLWLAPTIFEPHSRIAQVKSEMLAMGESGLPCLGYSCMERKGFLLDPTRDDSREWLFNLFSRFVGYGYSFFKLDFLAQTLNAVKFHDTSVGRGEIMRKILEPIREATLGKAVLLGCNYTFDAGDVLVDSVRVSGDIHADWNCIKRNSPSIAARFWTQDVFWDNDPDFALARGPETSDDPDLHSLKPGLVSIKPDSPVSDTVNCSNSFDNATADELETLLGLAIVSGGCVNLSDNLPRLNAKGVDLARRTVAAERGEAGVPLDLFEAAYPGVWIQKINAGPRILLVNWEDAERTLSFDAAEHGVTAESMRNFWTDESVAIDNGRVEVLLPPHASIFLSSNKR